MGRLLKVSILALGAVGCVVAWSGSDDGEFSGYDPPSYSLHDRVPDTTPTPADASARMGADRAVSVRPGDRALARMDKKEDELDERLARWVQDGEITEEEARQLHGAAMITLDEARSIVTRIQTGEIQWLGGWARSIPVRIRHASMVVNVLGYDRAVELAYRRRGEEQASAPESD